jgi:hypothetical protein
VVVWVKKKGRVPIGGSSALERCTETDVMTGSPLALRTCPVKTAARGSVTASWSGGLELVTICVTNPAFAIRMRSCRCAGTLISKRPSSSLSAGSEAAGADMR